MQHSLTKLQARCLKIIRIAIEKTGTAPTQAEISDGLGLSSKSQVNRLLRQLEDRGHISRMPGRHRAIALREDDVDDLRDAAVDFISIQEDFRREFDRDQEGLTTKSLAQRVTVAFNALRSIVRREQI